MPLAESFTSLGLAEVASLRENRDLIKTNTDLTGMSIYQDLGGKVSKIKVNRLNRVRENLHEELDVLIVANRIMFSFRTWSAITLKK